MQETARREHIHRLKVANAAAQYYFGLLSALGGFSVEVAILSCCIRYFQPVDVFPSREHIHRLKVANAAAQYRHLNREATKGREQTEVAVPSCCFLHFHLSHISWTD
jgi:hypothetical protein